MKTILKFKIVKVYFQKFYDYKSNLILNDCEYFYCKNESMHDLVSALWYWVEILWGFCFSRVLSCATRKIMHQNIMTYTERSVSLCLSQRSESESAGGVCTCLWLQGVSYSGHSSNEMWQNGKHPYAFKFMALKQHASFQNLTLLGRT